MTVDIGYMGSTEMVELPCEDLSIKKAVCRLGTDSVGDCKIEISTFTDLPDDLRGKVMAIEKNKDIFGLNELLKTVDLSVKQEKPESIFKQEIARKLSEEGYNFSFKNGEFSVISDGDVIKIRDNDVLYSEGAFSQNGKDKFYALYHLNRGVLDYCTAYEKAAPLKAEGLSGNYRCLSEFNGVVLAAKYNEDFGFEFVTWHRTYDGNAFDHGNYYEDYKSAKDNFAVRSGLVDKDKIFSTKELEQLGKCVNFTMRHNGDLKFDDCEFLKKISEKISENIPEQKQNTEPKMSM